MWIIPVGVFTVTAVVLAVGGRLHGTGSRGDGGVFRLMNRRHRATRHKLLEAQLDVTLSALASAISVTGNIVDALRDVERDEMWPMKEELCIIQKDMRLGKTMEEALLSFSRRNPVPGVDAAVTAIILGRQSGGDLSEIITTLATSLREMRRLEEVIRTRTAEGRGQAWVMGAIPPMLLVTLHFLNPQWLAPLWNDLLGWGILVACAVLEVAAVLLIRRIMAVDI